MPSQNEETTQISYVPGSADMELLSARWVEFEFPRHCHYTYLIEVVTAGTDEFLCGRKTFRAGPGDIIFIHPGEVHTGRSVGDVPLEYEALYPTVRLMSKLAAGAGRPSPPDFRCTVVHDPKLAHLIVAAVRKSQDPGGKSALEAAISEAILRHALSTAPDGKREEPLAVQQIKELVRLDPARNHRLADLAAHCGFSPYHLIRLFKRSVGLPPHEYLHAYRTELARELLREGQPAWLASDLLGYADQAHFTRKFRQIVGVSPGQFRRKPASK